jgi:hypothetical protein
MATYTKTYTATDKNNAQERIISSIISYAENYKTITSMTRYGGVWCSCGGTSQSVAMFVYDNLYDGSTFIKTSNKQSIKCVGSGPTAENCATTTFADWTTAESNAAIIAWRKGTLRVRREVEITKATSSGHGDPTFREGQYIEQITINGTEEEPTYYGPKIESFLVTRPTIESSEIELRFTASIKDREKFSEANMQVVFSYVFDGETISQKN